MIYSFETRTGSQSNGKGAMQCPEGRAVCVRDGSLTVFTGQDILEFPNPGLPVAGRMCFFVGFQRIG